MEPQSNGQLYEFASYLAQARRPADRPAHWPWPAIDAARNDFPHGERGTVALVSGDRHASGEVAPGLSLAVQTVLSDDNTGAHCHSFWHLYWVASGAGLLALAGESPRVLAPGDVIYVPPWCMHAFSNPDRAAPLVLFALQNLPQLAALGALMRETEDGARVCVHAPAPAGTR